MKTSFSPKTTAMFLLFAGMSFGLLYSSVGDADAAVPNKITDLQLTVISSSQVDMAWSTPADGGSPILSYQIDRNQNGVGILTIESTLDPISTGYSDTNLEMGDQLTYRVRAANVDGVGPWSNIPESVRTTTPALIQQIMNSINEILANILQLENDIANVGQSGLDVGGDLTIAGNILPLGDICIGTCP